MSLFITFEGVEGSGKSTQLALLAATLRSEGRDVTETREPGATVAGAGIRALLLGDARVPLEPLTELYLYFADRAQHVAEVVRPALARGAVVLCDRFSDSTLAYQGWGRGLDVATIRTLDELARGGLTPDLTVLLDVPAADGLARVRHRGGTTDRFEEAPLAFHERVRDGFHALAAEAPRRFLVVDATRPKEEVAAHVALAVRERLPEAAA